jgi:[ribosomal protein S5]-alanine N-acetyltransferase
VPGHVLDTERLTLREMAKGDLGFVAEMLAHPEVMRFYPKCYDALESAAWVNRQISRYREVGHGLWLVTLRGSGLPIGQVGLVLQTIDGVASPEIGYLLHRPFWRLGYAAEAAIGVRDYAFHTLGKQRVISLIRPENEPSQAVARKLGMTVEKNVLHAGIDHLLFAATRPQL